ncbi:unnamed protein product [Mytilus edulis]|uniref:Uncharacterized protein n=1 Tax=Mytilus edulis TaxID=6550 RepID=A0A8S3R3H7_MYTED|nr:unnamed protein product [Mytilus edulis]
MFQECQTLKVKVFDKANQEILLQIKQSREEMEALRLTLEKENLSKLQSTPQIEHSEVKEHSRDIIPRGIRKDILLNEFKGSNNEADSIRTTVFKAKPTSYKDDVEINGYKGANNENEFYRLNIVCDNFVVDCIIDNRLKRKCRKSVFEFQECTEEMIQWSETLSYFKTKVEGKLCSIVETRNSCLCQYLLNHTSNNTIETHILVNALHSSIENDDVDTAKFIGWQIARNFLKSKNVHVYDIWLASICSCSRLKKSIIHGFVPRMSLLLLWYLISSKRFAIPIGENHFPGELQGIPTDVIEGFPRFSSKHIRIGDSVTNTRVKGSLGGFCRFYGREAFLTCAHTMMDWDTLLSVELKHHMQQESIHVYTGDNILDDTLPCGKVVNHSFTQGNPKEISTDVALVEIGNGISVSADDCVKTKGNIPLHFTEFGLKSRYLQDGYIRSLHELPGQNVGVVCAGAVSGLNNSVSLISKVPKRVLEREDLQSASANLETRSIEFLKAQVSMSVHMKVKAIVHESRKEEAESDRTVRFYNQLAVHNIPFQQGDSGACVYITNGYTETGCLGMAIADLPGGGCIVTPMGKLLEKLGLI